MINSTNKMRTIGTLLVLVSAISLAGCNFQGKEDSQSAGGRKVVSYNEINQEYKDSVAKLDWPDSYTPPANLEGESGEYNFQTGYGDTRASQLFECAWAKEWLKTYATDTDKANAALEQLGKVFDMGYLSPERADDATRRFMKEYIDRAKLGDPSGLQTNVDRNCE